MRNPSDEIIINATDNLYALSWIDGIRVLVGPSSRLAPPFRRELIRRLIQAHEMYLRSEQNTNQRFPPHVAQRKKVIRGKRNMWRLGVLYGEFGLSLYPPKNLRCVLRFAV